MSRFSAAFSSFFSILFSGVLPDEVATEFGFTKLQPVQSPPPEPKIKVSDGALQLLQILQRDARLVDFLMEDIEGYGDDQVGAAVRSIHTDSRASLDRHFTLSSVIDGVEGTHQKLDSNRAPDPNRIRLIGNVPASGRVAGGTLRHRGWMASSVNLPPVGKQDLNILAPAEIEVE